MKGLTIICIIIPIFCVIILGILLSTQEDLMAEFLSYVVYFLMGGIITPIGILIISYLRKSNNDHSEIYQKIHEELRDGIESLDGTLDRKTRQHEINNKKINYKHIYMNHKTFDGYVNSGDFNQINHELQQPIQDIYGKIKIHDEFVKKIVELSDDSNHEEEYVSTLNKCEKELLSEIPSMIEKLIV